MWAPSIGPSTTPQSLPLTRCYRSGQSRTPDVKVERGQTVARIQPREYENCCYSQTFLQQKQTEAEAQRTAYLASLEAWRNSPAYKEFEQEMEEWRTRQRRAAQLQRRARALALHPATANPGDPCSPPEGGLVGKFPLPIPRTQADHLEQQLAFARLREQGCHSDERLFDLQHMEVCCPPGVQVGPPAPLTPPAETKAETTTPQPKRYFGLTATQLAFIGVGGIALYALLKR